MFIEQQAFEIYQLQRSIVSEDKDLNHYFDHTPNALYASIRNRKGHVLANLNVAEGDDNLDVEIQAYQKKLSLILMCEVA